MPDDHSSNVQTAGTVAVDGSVTGEIGHGGDLDWFAVTLEAGRTYRFSLEGSATDAGTLYDPHLRGIHDSNGNLIAGTADKNSGEGRNALVTFTPTEGGTYYVSAGAWRDWEGTYRLSVADLTAEDAHTAGTDTAGTVAVGGSVTGEIGHGGDLDWFAVTLEAGRTYRFSLEGSATDAGTLYDPHLRGIHDSNGNVIAGTAGQEWRGRPERACDLHSDRGRHLLRVRRCLARLGGDLQAFGDGPDGRRRPYRGDGHGGHGCGRWFGHRRDRPWRGSGLVRGDARGGQDLPVQPGGFGDGCRDLVRPASAGDSRFEREPDRGNSGQE